MAGSQVATVKCRPVPATTHFNMTASALSPLFARLQGHGAHTVLCLHSSTGSHAQWRGLATAVAEHAQVVALDFHGHGRSPRWPADAAPSLQVDARGAVQALRAAHPGADGVHLVAHSYGAAVALQIAQDHPQWVQSLALYEPVAFGVLQAMAPADSALTEIRHIADAVAMATALGRLDEAAGAFVDYWGGPGNWHGMTDAQRDAVQGRIATIPLHFDALFRARWSTEALSALTMPVLLMHGGCTRAPARRVADLLGTALPHARRLEISGAGHLGPMTHESAVNMAIGEHLRRVGALAAPARAEEAEALA
jgi:pimeloyl-ACP methyl ester carboxylesterase